ncbi:MAG: AAA family ATPase [Actinomycetota bacterium]
MRRTIIYLIGLPAVGKHTIATAIAARTGARVIDNQLINVPVFTAVGFDGTDAFPFPKGAWDKIERIREAVLDTIREDCAPEDCFVFTNVLDADDPPSVALFETIEALALDRGGTFVPIWLEASEAVMRQRIDTPQRRERRKTTDASSIDRWRNSFRLLEIDHPNAFRLDTSDLTPEQAADAILKHVNESGRGRMPS